MKIILCVGLLLLFSGCGMLEPYGRWDKIPEGYTQIQFSKPTPPHALLEMEPFGQVNANAVLGGGVFVYIQGISGTDFYTNIFLRDEASDAGLTVPNGKYRVFSFGYANTSFGGVVRCGYGENNAEIALTGGTKTIPIVVKESTCEDALFSESSHLDAATTPKKFKNLKVKICNKGSSFWPNTCQAVSSVVSVRVEIPIFMKTGGGATTLGAPPVEFSGCKDVISGIADTTFRLPVGSDPAQGHPAIPIRIIANSSACTSTGGETVLGSYEFNKGIFKGADAFYRDRDPGLQNQIDVVKVSSISTHTVLDVREP